MIANYDVSYCCLYVKNVFLTFYILQAVPPKHRGAQGNLSPYSPSQQTWVH